MHCRLCVCVCVLVSLSRLSHDRGALPMCVTWTWQAVLTKLALENEKAKLARENSQLQSVLKQVRVVTLM